MSQRSGKTMVATVICCFCVLGIAHATDPDPVPPETRVVASAAAAAPTQLSFTIPAPTPPATASDLVVTFTDLQIPAALVSADVVVAQGNAIVGSAALASPATVATAALPAAVGNYTMYIVGVPNANSSVGTFSVCVAPKANPANCIQSASLSGSIAARSTAHDPTVSTLSADLTVVTPGSYSFNFSDLVFPVALSTPPSLALFRGSNMIPGGLGFASGTSFMLSPGTYQLKGIAQADQTAKAGLYAITVVGPVGTTSIYDNAVPVGLINSAAPFTNPTPGPITVKVTDYVFPGALASASALVTSGGTALGTASAAGGAVSFPAPAATAMNPLKVWTYGSLGSTAGTFGVDVAGVTDLFTTAQAVGPSGATYAFAFVTPPLAAAGAYQAAAADLQFPSILNALSFAVAQNGVILKQSAAAGSVDFTAAAAPVVLLVSAQAPASGSASGNGLFDVNLQKAGATSLLYDKTQTVSSTSALFDSQTLTIGVNDSFTASLADLKLPAQFDTLALVVSHGTDVLGKIYGGGPFAFIGTPGSYQLTFVATPSAMQQFGLYGVSVVFTPPAVALTANVSSAVAGTAVTLTWTATNATSCTATGGSWTGSKSASMGSESVSLSGTTTYMLSCTGGGGTAAQSVMVTATQPASSGGGGGGSLEIRFLGLAAILLGLRMKRRSRVSVT